MYKKILIVLTVEILLYTSSFAGKCEDCVADRKACYLSADAYIFPSTAQSATKDCMNNKVCTADTQNSPCLNSIRCLKPSDDYNACVQKRIDCYIKAYHHTPTQADSCDDANPCILCPEVKKE